MSIPSSVGGTAEVSSHDELYQRVIWRLIPLLGLCYLTAYLDRINIGFAKLATVIVFAIASCAIMGAIPVFFSRPAIFLKGQAAATGFAAALLLACLLVIALPKHQVNR